MTEAPLSSMISLSSGCLKALRDLRETRQINTVVMHTTGTPQVLVAEVEANLTHDELLQALPEREPRLIVYELSFADKDGAHRHERLLILWMPPAAAKQQDDYTRAYDTLKDALADVRIHLTARRPDHLAYQRLVALATGTP
ncbi:cofilin family protein [Streptomyces sp. NPDC001594]|uniref:cofilin family protein n=1 Tax=Streptomyces sp. NPDC001594 TaxID=3364590 RepID=UPI0036C1AF16